MITSSVEIVQRYLNVGRTTLRWLPWVKFKRVQLQRV